MMRSAELRDCLQSPHLWYEKGVSAQVAADLEKAGELLKAAREHKDPMEQLNGAYKSMYVTSLALLHSIHYKVTGFRCLVTVLEDYFVKKGILEAAHVDKLASAQRLEGKPSENVEAADGFLAAARRILKQ
jgi:uncharacterized protein (UPF0332 family)